MARPPKLDSSRLWFSRLVDLIICHGVFALRSARRGGQDENNTIAETKRIFISRLTLRNHRVALTQPRSKIACLNFAATFNWQGCCVVRSRSYRQNGVLHYRSFSSRWLTVTSSVPIFLSFSSGSSRRRANPGNPEHFCSGKSMPTSLSGPLKKMCV